MKRIIITLALAAALLALLVAPPLAAATALQPTTVVAFTPGLTGASYGSFLRGMAADSQGNLVAALTVWGEGATDSNVGQIWSIPANVNEPIATMDLSPYGVLMSLVIAGSDRAYVAVYDFSGGSSELGGSGIFRVDGDHLTRVATFPTGSWPNGIAFHKGRLYVSDAAQGGIWRISVDGGIATPTTPWVKSPLLPAAKTMGIGVTGLAFKGDALYAAVWDSGSIVRVPVKKDGTAGSPALVCRQKELKTADGIAFDRLGRLWVAVNGSKKSPDGALYRVATDGAVAPIVDDPGWLDYPTMPVFGRTEAEAGTLFVANGDYYGYAEPSIISLPVGVAGLPLR